MFYVACGGFFLALAVSWGYDSVRPKQKTSRTLFLRKLKQEGDDVMSAMSGGEVSNPFLEEFLKLFMLFAHTVDYAVMKYVGSKVPLLVKQEYGHAKMHHQAVKKEKVEHGDSMGRWKWFLFLSDLFLLRVGKTIGTALCGYVEASSWVWGIVPECFPFVRFNGFMSDLMAFHALEEAEHAAVTLQELKPKSSVLVNLLLFPLAVVFHALYMLLPPFVCLLTQPVLLLQPKTYVHLLLYYLTFIPTFIITVLAMMVYWLFPVVESGALHAFIYKRFLKQVERRDIKFDVVAQEVYPLFI